MNVTYTVRGQLIAIPWRTYIKRKEKGMQPMLVIFGTFGFWKVSAQCHRGIALPLRFTSLIESIWIEKIITTLYLKIGIH